MNGSFRHRVILLAALLQVIFGTCIKSASSEKSVLRFPVTVWGVYVSVFFLSVFLCSFVAMNFYGELATVIVFLSSSLALRRYFWLKDKKESDEVANTAYGHEFDVLSEVYGRKVRLPFNKRNVGKVIGIFPFADSGEYLELEEYFHKKHTDKDVDNSRLLNVSFCERVAKIHNRLEKHLEKSHRRIENQGRNDEMIQETADGKDGYEDIHDYGSGTQFPDLAHIADKRAAAGISVHQIKEIANRRRLHRHPEPILVIRPKEIAEEI